MDLYRNLKIVVSETITIGSIQEAVEFISRVYSLVIEKISHALRARISVNLFSRPPTSSFTILDMQKLPA